MRGLYHGDCLNVMKDLPERSVDLILCDLPYACGKTKHKWDKEIDLAALWKAYNPFLHSRKVRAPDVSGEKEAVADKPLT